MMGEDGGSGGNEVEYTCVAGSAGGPRDMESNPL